MTKTSEFRDALERACEGSEEDMRRFVQQFGPYLQRVVRMRLDQRLRSKFDSIDFVQMVWASFFARPDPLARFADNPEDLVRFLAQMARNKVIDESRRRLQTQRYDVAHEQPLPASEHVAPKSPEATPSQFAIAQERLNLLESGTSEQERQIIRLRMIGASFEEIAAKVGLHERTVRRIVERIGKKNDAGDMGSPTTRSSARR